MKKVRVIIALCAILLTGITVVSCTGNNAEKSTKAQQEKTVQPTDSTSTSASVDGFVCPMGCEDNKVYEESGECPDCGMTLVPTKS